MSNPAAPGISGEPQRPHQAGQPGIVSDPDQPNTFGPDAPNVRPENPQGDEVTPEAVPPSPPITRLDDENFAPDEA